MYTSNQGGSLMKKTTIYERNGYRLISYGNGWAYEIQDMVHNKSAWLQDEDAHQFRDDFERAYEFGTDYTMCALFGSYEGVMS